MLETSVHAFIKKHGLLENSSVLLLGVSGGPDSMALLHYMDQLSRSRRLRLVVCCVDHSLRGAESIADLEFVEAFCQKLGIPFAGRTVEVNDLKEKTGMGTQEAARVLRYQALKDVFYTYKADTLVLAHHGDDQIETMLMNAVKGVSGMKRAGMPVMRRFEDGQLIRPFLCIDKKDILNYCHKYHISYREDPSNTSEKYTRNRYRKHILPFLKAENPRVHEKFQAESEQILEDEAFMNRLAESHLEQVVSRQEQTRISLSLAGFLSIPQALQRRVIHLILNYLYTENKKQSRPDSGLVKEMLHWIHEGKPNGELSLPAGLRAVKGYESLTLTFSAPETPADDYKAILAPAGKAVSPGGVFVSTFDCEAVHKEKGSERIFINPQKNPAPYVIRNRRPGDRILQKGSGGTKKIKDLFIDRKVAPGLRSVWPIVTDANGTIIWVPMLKLGDQVSRARTDDHSLSVTYYPTETLGGFIHEG